MLTVSLLHREMIFGGEMMHGTLSDADGNSKRNVKGCEGIHEASDNDWDIDL